MKNLHSLTIKALLDSVSLPCRCRVLFRYVATLALFLCLGIGHVWGNDYYLSGEENDWNVSDAMAVSSGGNYEYYTSSLSPNNFVICRHTPSWETYDHGYVKAGYNGTDILTIGGEEDCTVSSSPTSSYYIIIWKPNTPFNGTNTPVICASTTLPMDEVVYSARAITTTNVAVSRKSNLTVPSTAATITGGTMVIYNRYKNDDLTPIRPNFGPTEDQRPAFYLSGASVSFQVNISGGRTLEEGDVISAKIFAKQYPIDGNGLWFSTSTSRPGSAPNEKADTTAAAAGSAWTYVSYTVTSTDALHGVSSFYIYLGERGTGDNKATIVFTDFVITPPCAAPSSVTVTPTNANGWRYSIGETIDLTCTATGGTGTKTYQWQKYIDSDWEDIEGETSARLQIANCTSSDGGSYRCVVSTGSACSLASDGYFVRVFTLNGNYSGNSFEEHAITWTGTYTGTVTLNLDMSSTYEFKVYDNDGKYFGYSSNNYIIQPVSWDCGINNANCRLLTGPAGNYTFTINIQHAEDGSPYVNVQVAYPDVLHPSPGYVYITKWWDCYVHYWEGTSNTLTSWGSDPQINNDRYVNICGTNYWYFPVIETYNKFIAKDNAGDPSNTTGDQVTTDHGGMYITHDGSNWVWNDFNVNILSFNGGWGEGTMNPIVICSGSNQVIPSNTFTRTNYTFAGWIADVDVKVGGVTISAGSTIANGATLENVNSDITLYAKWTFNLSVVEIPGTVNKANKKTVSGGSWWTDNNYYDLTSTSSYMTWDVYLSVPGLYNITETYQSEWYKPKDGDGFWLGHQWQLDLLDEYDNVVSTYQTTRFEGEKGTRTDNIIWDLSNVEPGRYTLRVTNPWDGSKPKLKDITLGYCFVKVPDRALYGDARDRHRAVGTIDTVAITSFNNLPLGAISISGENSNILTIGNESPITAPLTARGRLDNIPYDEDPGYTAATCVWRFDHWETEGGFGDIKAVYIPTFDVEYDTKDGEIHDDPYAHWYRYTGREEDETALPMNVTKEGFIFGGWYQDTTTVLFTALPGHYYGPYKGKWCLKAHWILDCDEAQTLSKVTITGSDPGAYTATGYNNNEYTGTPVVSVGSTTASADINNDGNNETGFELSGDGVGIVFATLGKGTFRVGDRIRIAITAANTHRRISNTTDHLTLYYGTGADDATLLVNIRGINSAQVVEYILDADDVLEMQAAHATGVGVFREASNGENPCVYSVEIFGCRDLVFDDYHNTHVWSDPRNWGPTYTEIPSYYQATRIIKPCIVDIPTAQALNVKLCKEYEDRNGTLTINANAALAVEQTISVVRGVNYDDTYPVQASDLVILSNASNQGALVHGDNGSNTHATVQFYARGAGAIREGNTSNLDDATWQYMGVPFSDVSNAQSHYYAGWMCQWIENTVGNAGSNWKWIVNGNPLYPFTGYCLTQAAPKTYTNTGTLVASTNQTLELTYEGTTAWKGWNMFANSWMAPIDVSKFIAADFVGEVEQSIYQFNTGISNGTTAVQGEGAGAGQYVAVPIESASSMLETNRYISPMQGFYVFANASGTNRVTLNYDRLVRKSDHSALSVGPNRAKKVEDDEPTMARIIIDVKGEHFSDRLYVFENAEQTNGFDNGWDGWKFEGESYAPQLMTRTGDLDLAVDVSPAFGGKRIAFRVGEDTEYTLHFSSTEEGLYLRDLSNNIETEIIEGGTYTFMAFNTTSEERFEIVDRRAELPDGLEEVTDNATYDILDMTVYTAEGRLVLHRTTDFNKPLNLPQTGAYIINLNTTNGKQVHKIIF